MRIQVIIRAVIAAALLGVANPPMRGAGQELTKDQSAENEMLKSAKLVVTACRTFAQDHQGRFPSELVELCPDYLRSRAKLACSLSPEEPIGYDYFGGTSKGPTNITLQSKAPTKDGRWIIVYNTGDVEFRTTRYKKPE